MEADWTRADREDSTEVETSESRAAAELGKEEDEAGEEAAPEGADVLNAAFAKAGGGETAAAAAAAAASAAAEAGGLTVRLHTGQKGRLVVSHWSMHSM